MELNKSSPVINTEIIPLFSKVYDISRLSNYIFGREEEFIKVFQRLFNVKLKICGIEETDLEVSFFSKEMLEMFDISLELVLSNPSTIDAFLALGISPVSIYPSYCIQQDTYNVSEFRQCLFGIEEFFIQYFLKNYGVTIELSNFNFILLKSVSKPQIELCKAMLDKFKKDLIFLYDTLGIHYHLIDITSQHQIFTKNDGEVLRFLSRDYEIRSEIIQNTVKYYIKYSSEDKDNLNIFKFKIETILLNPIKFEDEIRQRKQSIIHICVDVSNISVGLKRENRMYRDDSRSLHVSNLIDLVSGLRNRAQKNVAVGSVPTHINNRNHFFNHSQINRIWEEWRTNGFEVYLRRRVRGPSVPHVGRTTTGGRGVGSLQRKTYKRTREVSFEESIDDILHAQIMSLICNTYPQQRTLILLTGDGNHNSHRTDFPTVIDKALLNDWKVEVWSWRICTSQIYLKYADTYPSHFSLRWLDPHRDFLTYPPRTHSVTPFVPQVIRNQYQATSALSLEEGGQRHDLIESGCETREVSPRIYVIDDSDDEELDPDFIEELSSESAVIATDSHTEALAFINEHPQNSRDSSRSRYDCLDLGEGPSDRVVTGEVFEVTAACGDEVHGEGEVIKRRRLRPPPRPKPAVYPESSQTLAGEDSNKDHFAGKDVIASLQALLQGRTKDAQPS